MAGAEPRPTMSYWHVYTNADGASEQVLCELTQFDLQGIGPGVSPPMERQDGAGQSRRDLHRSSRRLGRRLARESKATMDRGLVRPLVRGNRWTDIVSRWAPAT